MKIDVVTFPNISGVSPIEAIRILHESLCNTMQAIMTLNNEIESLKSEVERLKSP